MTKVIESVPVADLKIGQAYNVARCADASGRQIPVRRGDWRAVLLTADNLASYTDGIDGRYLFQPIKDKHTPRLLAAGWVRSSSSEGECGMEIVTPGPLLGLACAKPAFWSKDGCIAQCAQHAVMGL